MTLRSPPKSISRSNGLRVKVELSSIRSRTSHVSESTVGPSTARERGIKTTQKLDQKLGTDPLQPETALLPNYGMYVDLPNAPNPTLGGLDEPWDAVDFQNMFLAMNPPNPRIRESSRRSTAPSWSITG